MSSERVTQFLLGVVVLLQVVLLLMMVNQSAHQVAANTRIASQLRSLSWRVEALAARENPPAANP